MFLDRTPVVPHSIPATRGHRRRRRSADAWPNARENSERDSGIAAGIAADVDCHLTYLELPHLGNEAAQRCVELVVHVRSVPAIAIAVEDAGRSRYPIQGRAGATVVLRRRLCVDGEPSRG